MPAKNTPPAEAPAARAYIFGASKRSDVVSTALRSAFDARDDAGEDFAALLLQIDDADRRRKRL